MPDLSSIGRAIIQLKWYGLDSQHNNNLSRRLSKTYPKTCQFIFCDALACARLPPALHWPNTGLRSCSTSSAALKATSMPKAIEAKPMAENITSYRGGNHRPDLSIGTCYKRTSPSSTWRFCSGVTASHFSASVILFPTFHDRLWDLQKNGHAIFRRSR